MDILHLIDRLEILVTEKSFRIPFTSNVVLQEDEFLDIIDQMRVSIPEEVKLAKRTEAERERLLLQAQEEADRLIAVAREKAKAMTEDHELIVFARQRAKEIEAEARVQAQEIIADADEYIVDQLSELEEQLMKTLTTVRNGLRQVRETQEKKKNAVAKALPLEEEESSEVVEET
ncbi:MAG: ATPase [Anaerolineae bacterium]|nr:ATPase [Anaerolineae bacterium]